MNVERYLDRIGLGELQPSPGYETLVRLQLHHLLSVPFENLDIHWGNQINLDAGLFFDKIVLSERGGFCYELNGLFEKLLRQTGFQTRLVSARVFNGTGFGPEFDHAAIIVTFDENEFLVDVGFGDFTAGPLQIVTDFEQRDREGVFRIVSRDRGDLIVEKLVDAGWRPEYLFTLPGRDLSDFSEMCSFQQYSPQSHFTKGFVCSILTAAGRKTLTDRKFIVTSNGDRNERDVTSISEFETLLDDEFGIRRIQ